MSGNKRESKIERRGEGKKRRKVEQGDRDIVESATE